MIFGETIIIEAQEKLTAGFYSKLDRPLNLQNDVDERPPDV